MKIKTLIRFIALYGITLIVNFGANAQCTPSINGNTVICMGQSTTLTASGASNYSWSTGNTSATIIVSPSAPSTYTVTATTGTCVATAMVTVTVSPPPIGAATNAIICEGQTATLTATGGGNYTWSNGSTANPIIVSPTSSTTYTVIVSIGSCSDTTTATVLVNPNPQAVAWNNITITAGSSATLSASGGGTYTWSNGATGTPISVSPTISSVYCVTVSNGNCTDSACITVWVIPAGINEVFFFDLISIFPNPSNGLFTIQSSDPATPIRVTSIEITNVLGEKMYSSLNNPRLTSYEIDLRKQPKGIYFYRIESENKNTANGKIIIE